MIKLLFIGYMYTQEIYRYTGMHALESCEASALQVNLNPTLRELKVVAVCLDTEARQRSMDK